MDFLFGLITLLLTLMEHVKITLPHEKYIVGIAADELLRLQSINQRNLPLFHLSADEENFSPIILRLFLAHDLEDSRVRCHRQWKVAERPALWRAAKGPLNES